MEKIRWIEEYLEEAMRLAWDEGYEPALKLLQRLLYEEPGYARLHNVLGKIYFLFAEENAAAEKHFRAAIRFDAELAEPYVHLGALLYGEDRLSEAIRIYRRGLKAKQSDKSKLLANVAQAYELKHRYEKAIRHYKDALRHSAELWNCLTIEESIKRCKRKQR